MPVSREDIYPPRSFATIPSTPTLLAASKRASPSSTVLRTASASQRLLHNRPAIEIQTVEQITHGWMAALGAGDTPFPLGMQSPHDIGKNRSARPVQANDFAIEHGAARIESLLRQAQFRKVSRHIALAARLDLHHPFLDGDDRTNTVPLYLIAPFGPQEAHRLCFRPAWAPHLSVTTAPVARPRAPTANPCPWY